MFLLKKLLFKLMELGLGVRPCFTLATRNPVFVNFRLSEEEAEAVQRDLPPGFTLRALRFTAGEGEPAYWVSYNLYELEYPRPEMAAIRKVRCEINTFVRDAEGRDGVFVFCGSPYVSKEKRRSVMGTVCDMAERLVIFLYGCGRLSRLLYQLTEDAIRIDLDEGGSRLRMDLALDAARPGPTQRLSEDYHRFNDISFFNAGKTYDRITVDSAFGRAAFERVGEAELAQLRVDGPFFQRAPDHVYFHRGDVGYVVSALHRPHRAHRPGATA